MTPPTKLACVGDSITFGMGIRSPDDAYPAALGRALGAGFEVGNFGHSGATARFGGDVPYVEQAAFQRSLALAPQIVVLMLGTNDSKARNWNAAAYEADVTALVRRYRDLPSRPRVHLALPCPAFAGNDTISDAVLRDEIGPILRRIAAAHDLQLVDVRAALEGQPHHVPDGIHPNAAGAALIARAVAAALAPTAAERRVLGTGA